MPSIKATVLLALSLVALSGCTHYYYGPNQHNVPLFKEKNEARLSGAYTPLGEGANGVEIQAAYSPTKRLGVLANVCLMGVDIPEISMRQLYELGAGYFKAFGISHDAVFECYGVTGMGFAENYTCHPQHVGTSIFKAYVQPSIGYTHDVGDIFVSTKVGVLHFYNIHENLGNFCYPDPWINYQYDNGEAMADLALLESQKTSFLFGQYYSVRFGYRFVKLNIQGGWEIIDGRLQELNALGNFNIGLIFSFAPRFLKKNKKQEDAQH